MTLVSYSPIGRGGLELGSHKPKHGPFFLLGTNIEPKPSFAIIGLAQAKIGPALLNNKL